MNTQNKSAWIGNVPSSPLGMIWIAVSDNGLAAIQIHPDGDKFKDQLRKMGYSQIFDDPVRVSSTSQQLEEYFVKKRTDFDLIIDWSNMLPFQEQVLKATLAIPYGQTSTYGEIAFRLDKPQAARAVGRAEATNPIPLVIPCHRVIGADGKLHGYGGGKGIETKAWLLKFESGK
ncbi:MAG: methylated-DNA--[protein]-cysteine S-methyltransferase [Anaerolineales bacterium]|nr:methylated-DNA--[protein]-cysteine S-methyltransferase [Anaerolineales bacterium]